ncbi:hypothetical protein HPP92_012199 [Vanilla planifolia]|uniref:Dof zinc finger protein n=1 Tax=Vanilla planifolia TaxID=51239 RepID=A0A835R275_VANPL|nr:hypothetical protein HPP92_012589 [Vanilla planifolia]KAG0484115.1 hypothetical protein HPP92_012199 [Vanilla planifolia]
MIQPTMAFTSVPIYIDPPNNWNQQQESAEASSIPGDASFLHPQMLQQPAAIRGGAGGSAPGRPSSMAERARQAKLPPPETALNCPRCNSANTKFCYYNNYSLSQPRHFCKSCRRYWTRGGALRNVPIGGGFRRNKRSKSSASSSSNTAPSSSSYNQSPTTAGATTASSSSSAASASTMAGRILPSTTASFLPPWHRLHDNTPINETVPVFPGFQRECSARGFGPSLEQWSIWQTEKFPFFGGMAALTSSATAVEMGRYDFGDGQQLTPTGQGQFVGAPRNDQQLWGVGDGSVGGGGGGGEWMVSTTGFNSSSITGSLL